MGTWLSSELGKVKGGEEEKWHPTSVTPMPGTSRLFKIRFPDGHQNYGTTLPYLTKHLQWKTASVKG